MECVRKAVRVGVKALEHASNIVVVVDCDFAGAIGQTVFFLHRPLRVFPREGIGCKVPGHGFWGGRI
jgi:hypothetical protein